MPGRSRLSGTFRIALLAAAMSVAACGDDGPAGPSDDFDIVGAWSWRVTNATTTNASCSVTGVTLTFVRTSGGVLSGHRLATGGGNITCTINGSNSTANYVTNSALGDLVHNGTDISFSFPTNTGPWEMEGEIQTDNSMGGPATIRLNTSIGTLVLTGPWTATRN